MARPYQSIFICLLTVSIVVGAVYFLHVDNGVDHTGTRVPPPKTDHPPTTTLAATPGATTDSHSTESHQPPGTVLPTPAPPDKGIEPMLDSYSESQGYGPPDRNVDVTALYLIRPTILESETNLKIKHVFNDQARFDMESLGGIHLFPMMNSTSTSFFSLPIVPSMIPLDPLLFDETDGMILFSGTPREPFSVNGIVWK